MDPFLGSDVLMHDVLVLLVQEPSLVRSNV